MLFLLEYGAPEGWSGDNIASERWSWFSALTLKSVMASPDGSEKPEVTVETMGVVSSVEEALELGKQAARSLLEKGGRAIIVDLRAEIDCAKQISCSSVDSDLLNSVELIPRMCLSVKPSSTSVILGTLIHSFVRVPNYLQV